MSKVIRLEIEEDHRVFDLEEEKKLKGFFELRSRSRFYKKNRIPILKKISGSDFDLKIADRI